MSPSSSRWRLQTQPQGDVLFVRLLGSRIELEEEAARSLRDLFSRLVEETDRQKVVLDLGNVHFLTSTVVETLLALHRQLQALGRRLVVCNLTPPVAEVFTVLQLGNVFEVDPPPPAVSWRPGAEGPGTAPV